MKFFRNFKQYIPRARYLVPTCTAGLFVYGINKSDGSEAPKPVRGQRLDVNINSKDHHVYTLRNRVWTEAELQARYETATQHHSPNGKMDHFTYGFLRGLYSGFNWLTGFDHNDPTPESMKLRLILLESVAGVPPFMP